MLKYFLHVMPTDTFTFPDSCNLLINKRKRIWMLNLFFFSFCYISSFWCAKIDFLFCFYEMCAVLRPSAKWFKLCKYFSDGSCRWPVVSPLCNYKELKLQSLLYTMLFSRHFQCLLFSFFSVLAVWEATSILCGRSEALHCGLFSNQKVLSIFPYSIET